MFHGSRTSPSYASQNSAIKQYLNIWLMSEIRYFFHLLYIFSQHITQNGDRLCVHSRTVLYSTLGCAQTTKNLSLYYTLYTIRKE